MLDCSKAMKLKQLLDLVARLLAWRIEQVEFRERQTGRLYGHAACEAENSGNTGLVGCTGRRQYELDIGRRVVHNDDKFFGTSLPYNHAVGLDVLDRLAETRRSPVNPFAVQAEPFQCSHETIQ